MLKQAVRELRFHPSRFVSTVLAVAISVAFMAGSSVLVATEQNSVSRQVSIAIAAADVVVTAEPGVDLEAVRTALAEAAGVAVVEPSLTSSFGLRHGRTTALFNLVGLPSPALRWSNVEQGRWPEAAHEVVLGRGGAQALGVQLGGTVTTAASDESYTVVGLTGEPASLFVQTGYVAAAEFARIAGVDPTLGVGTWVVKAAPGVVPSDLATTLGLRLSSIGEVDVKAAAQVRDEGVKELANGFDVFRNLLWAFAAVAAVVGMITIANTFTILLAQRRRQIGLLRAVGASGGQVRRRFFLEAVLLGVLGSVLGIAFGLGLAAIGSTLTGSLYWGLAMPIGDLALAFAAGLVITVVAAYVPVLRGTRVRPLEALQPVATSDERRRGSLVRAVVCSILVVAGLVLALVGLGWSEPLVPAIAGSLLIAVGVLFGAPLFVPTLLRGVSAVIGRFGVTSKLAGQNAVRNPRRASATATALMLAVGLIVTLQVGTATVRATMLDQIDRSNPIDIAVYAWDYKTPVPADLVDKLTAIPGVEAAARLDSTTVDFTRAGEELGGLLALGYDSALAGVVAEPPAGVDDGQVLVTMGSEDAKDGQAVTVKGARGSVDLTVLRSQLVEGGQVMVSRAALDKLGGVVPGGVLWLSVPDRSQALSVMGVVSDLVDQDTFRVAGGIVNAAATEEVLNLLLLITTALLAVAVLIALVGVSNTLGLSVLERTRESALMRSLGLQARSLRVMLLIEALMLAVAGVAVGIVAGLFFGWLGARALATGVDSAFRFAVDVPQTAGMVVIAILAAALASVLPGRRAAKAAPVEALADI